MNKLRKVVNSVLPEYIQFLLKVYLLSIPLFMLFRLVIFFNYSNLFYDVPKDERLIIFLKAFFMGFRFDTVISSYFLLVPFVVLFVLTVFGIKKRAIYKALFYFLGITYTVGFLICAIDIPFFNHYFARLTMAIFLWDDETKFMLGMIIGTFSFVKYILLFLIITALFWYLFSKPFNTFFNFVNNSKEEKSRKNFYIVHFTSFVIVLLLLFIGIRGRVEEKSPIRVGTAYFSPYSFPNQLGLNPVFTLLNNYFDSMDYDVEKINLMDDKSALANVRKEFNVSNYDSMLSPIDRKVETLGQPVKKNIVLVILESMSFNYTQKKLTPVLNDLSNKSYYFTNVYTTGIHTFNGIFSTLFSIPSLMRQHPMKDAVQSNLYGLPHVLKKNGYKNLFFVNHDTQFDNINGFMMMNDFDAVIGESEFPSKWVLSTLGVPDHIMFEESISHINKLSNSSTPFLAVYMTASNHDPIVLPDAIPFNATSTDVREKIVEYSDWSIGHFLKLASKQKWFDNTMFVFIADHGVNVEAKYDLPLSFVHTPLIIYSPTFLNKPKVFESNGSQLDVFPTLMGLLNISYVNSTFGVDLIRDKRPYTYFSADDNIGCLNDKYFFLKNSNGLEFLYAYKLNSIKNEIENKKDLADSMRLYTYSMMQTAQYIMRQRKLKTDK